MGTRRTRTPSARRDGALRRASYEQTTVAEIASRAGVTERTFFRHFADKREVFFHGTHAFEALWTETVERRRRS